MLIPNARVDQHNQSFITVNSVNAFLRLSFFFLATCLLSSGEYQDNAPNVVNLSFIGISFCPLFAKVMLGGFSLYILCIGI